MTNAGAEWLDSARRLVESLRSAAAAPADAPAGTPGAPGTAAAGGDCRWCPLCQAAAVVRGERPEVSAALADILTTTAAALREFAQPSDADGGAPAARPGADGRAGERADRPDPAATPVQRIEVT
jgi:hypothetical protein